MASKVSGYIGRINPGNGTQYSLGSTAYGYCETAAATAAKTVDMTGFILIEGATIFIKFKYNNTSTDDPTLNVNSTGAKPLIPKTWYAGAILSLTYDGTSWIQANAYLDASVITSGTLPTARGGTGATSYRINSVIVGSATPTETGGTVASQLTWVPSASGALYATETNGTPQFGTLPVAQGGTGNTSQTANRLIYSETDSKLSSSGHYASSGKVAINSTTAPTENFYVNGTSYFNGNSTVNGDLTIHRDTTIAQNYPATLYFETHQTDNDNTYKAYIRVYDDHDSANYGTNMVIQSGGNVFISGGEAAGTLYTNNYTGSAGEHVWIVADVNAFIYGGAQTITNRAGIQVNNVGNVLPVKAEAANDNVQNLGASDSRWANIYSAYTHSSTFYFGVPSFGGASRAMLVYSPTYPNHGIWYFDETNDTMTLDVHGKANSKTEADLAIGALGAGIISTRNRYIPHTNNTTGTVGTQYIPVYVNAGTITQITANSVLTNLGSTTAASTYADSPRPGVTGTLPIANGGTGATTRLAAAKNLTNENVTSPGYVVSLTQNWANFGYTSIANLKTTLGLGANTTAASSATKQWAAHYTNATTISPTSSFYFTSTPSFVADREGSGQGFTVATNGTQIGRFYSGTRGTTSTNGITYLIVGNNVANGTAENAEGVIQLHGSNTGRHRIQAAPNANTSNYTHYFPHRTGWIATGGTATAGSEAGVGSATQPVYLSSAGVLTACSAYIPQIQIVEVTMTDTTTLSITFDFAPNVVIALNPTYGNQARVPSGSFAELTDPQMICDMSRVTTSYTAVRNNSLFGGWANNSSGNYVSAHVYMKKSSDGKTLYLQGSASVEIFNDTMWTPNSNGKVRFMGIACYVKTAS